MLLKQMRKKGTSKNLSMERVRLSKVCHFFYDNQLYPPHYRIFFAPRTPQFTKLRLKNFNSKFPICSRLGKDGALAPSTSIYARIQNKKMTFKLILEKISPLPISFSTLDRYLMLQIFPNLLLSVSAFTIVSLFLGVFIRLLREVLISGLPIPLMFEIVLVQIPKFFSLVTPFACFLSSFIVFERLKESKELIAFFSLGISPFRLLLPPLYVSFLSSTAIIFCNEVLLPASSDRIKSIMKSYLEENMNTLNFQNDFIHFEHERNKHEKIDKEEEEEDDYLKKEGKAGDGGERDEEEKEVKEERNSKGETGSYCYDGDGDGDGDCDEKRCENEIGNKKEGMQVSNRDGVQNEENNIKNNIKYNNNKHSDSITNSKSKLNLNSNLNKRIKRIWYASSIQNSNLKDAIFLEMDDNDHVKMVITAETCEIKKIDDQKKNKNKNKIIIQNSNSYGIVFSKNQNSNFVFQISSFHAMDQSFLSKKTSFNFDENIFHFSHVQINHKISKIESELKKIMQEDKILANKNGKKYEFMPDGKKENCQKDKNGLCQNALFKKRMGNRRRILCVKGDSNLSPKYSKMNDKDSTIDANRMRMRNSLSFEIHKIKCDLYQRDAFALSCVVYSLVGASSILISMQYFHNFWRRPAVFAAIGILSFHLASYFCKHLAKIYLLCPGCSAWLPFFFGLLFPLFLLHFSSFSLQAV